MEHDANKLLADFIKNRAEAKAFMKDAGEYLSKRGFALSEKDEASLKSVVESLLKKAPLKEGGHTDFSVHTDYTSGDHTDRSNPRADHTNKWSHTDHTSKY